MRSPGPRRASRSWSGQDKIFSFLTYSTWASASIHDDLEQYKLPAVGVWAYSQTEWQDPYMFPTHMSMIHEAMAGANWAKNVVKPKTYGLICLTSPEMQLACNEVEKILDQSGSKMVKRADVSISETSMSSYVLAMRAANPEHIIHYVINPATMAKFMVESAQQDYYPPKGIPVTTSPPRCSARSSASTRSTATGPTRPTSCGVRSSWPR